METVAFWERGTPQAVEPRFALPHFFPYRRADHGHTCSSAAVAVSATLSCDEVKASLYLERRIAP